MPDRTSALSDELVAAQRELLSTLDRVAATDWQRPSPNEGWTIRDLLTHLTTAEIGFVSTIRRMAAGQGGVPADFDPNRWNAGQLRRRLDSQPDQLRQELEAAHQEMLAVLGDLDGTALDQRGHLSSGEEGSTADAIRLVARHKRGHTRDIQAALASA
jgi:uncharacterized protein (TIGR03083 family)